MDEPHRTSLEYAELDATTLCPAGPREGTGEKSSTPKIAVKLQKVRPQRKAK